MNSLEAFFNFQDLTGTFSVTDIALCLTLSFALTAIIGLVYRHTHRGTSYTQSFVQTLVLMGMVVGLIMLVVGSNIARAFSLVGALSIIRFRNAVKETRDVGFVFFAMAIGMAAGTRFYLLAAIGTAVICLALLMMNKFNWYARNEAAQLLKVQVPIDMNFDSLLDDAFLKFTETSELVSVESVRAGALTELVYSLRVKKNTSVQALLEEVRKRNGNNKVTIHTGYNSTDL